MKVNVFEGARRISLVIAVLWTIGCVAYAVLSKPYAAMTYAVAWPGEHPKRVEHCGDEDAREYSSAAVAENTDISLTLCFTAQRADNGQKLIPYKAMPPEPAASSPPGQSAKNGWEAAPVQLPEGTTVRELYQALKDADARGDTKKASEVAAIIKALPAAVRPPRFWMNGRFDSDVREYTKAVAAQFSLDQEGIADAKARVRDARMEQWKQAALTLVFGLIGGWLFVACVGWIVRGLLGIPRGQDSRPSSTA